MERKLYPAFKLLLVDDERPFLRSLSLTLERLGGISNVVLCQDSRKVPEIIDQGEIGLVILDLNMPGLSGKDILEIISRDYPEIGVIIISGINLIENAVECMKLGAIDYYVKTTEEDRLIRGIYRAIQFIEMQQAHQEIRKRLLGKSLEHPEIFREIVTNDKAMNSIFQYIESVAPSSQPILITGESGVGKELIAKACHDLSGDTGPLVSVNVAGLDDTIFSDTLFGHVPGAYTSANEHRVGMIEKAAGGTLFLDEIGDLSIPSQIKLLRLLQNGEYYPLGSDKPKRLKSRIIVATHQDLEKKEAAGEFRKDLYYRLYTHHVDIPALRDRRGDIQALLDHFLAQASKSIGKKIPTYPKELLTLLSNYSFPGNIRQLQSMVLDAMSTHKGGVLSLETFKKKMGQMTYPVDLPNDEEEDRKCVFSPSEPLPHIRKVADMLVLEAMHRAKGNQSIACRLIGISQPALSKRLKKLEQAKFD